MGISHQAGSIVLRGKAWYGFYRKDVIDPITEDVRSVRVCVRLPLQFLSVPLQLSAACFPS
jgi:hypothetical protein